MTNRIRIGNQTAFSAARLMEPLEFAVEHGFGAFEWFSDKKQGVNGSAAGWQESDIEEKHRSDIRSLGESEDIRYTVHAPWQANPLHPDAGQLLRNSVDFARDIGADLVNLHLYMDLGIHAYVDGLAPIISYAGDREIQLSIENTPLTGPADFNRLFRFLNNLELDTSHLGMCLDIGHANLYSGTRNDYIRYIDELTPEVPIIHLHLHENWGDSDSHLTLFTGPARDSDAGLRALAERLQKRRYKGAMILEQWPQPPELLVEAEQRFRALLSTPKANRRRHASKAATASSGDEEPEPHPGGDALLQTADQHLIDGIAAAHARYPSWRQRLIWIKELVLATDFTASPGQLASLAVYLRFLGTGELACEEDGRHFRPHHHAQAAQAIEARLESLTSTEHRWLLRKIYPWLPSHQREFQRSEPLTRIRDIAHRNDLPKALKHEIKHRLQNKLHRCAGPEDLRTAGEILDRITRPEADFAPAFVTQFKIFYRELSEFFNAGSLDQRLEDLLPSLPPEEAKRVSGFLALKADSDGSGRELELLESLTGVRDGLSRLLPDADAQAAQAMRLTDIGLEDFAFALLSEAANRISSGQWDRLLSLLRIVVGNLRRSEIETDECAAVVSELHAWRPGYDPSNRFHLLRLKATLERIRRINETYTDQILALFPPRAAALGARLGVAGPAVKIYSEGDIRGHLVFQAARLTELSEGAVRKALNSPPWSAVAPGVASGQLVHCSRLASLAGADRPLILLLDAAEGDEEIPPQVVGILLRQPIPHLSHLGVRARQARIPFASSEQPAQGCEFEQHLNKPVRLRVAADSLTLDPEDETAPRAEIVAPVTRPSLPVVDLEPGDHSLQLAETTAACCGTKASGAGRLLSLARASSGLFTAADGLALPFGVLTRSLAQMPEQQEKYQRLRGELPESATEAVPDALKALRRILLELPVQAAILQEIQDYFGPNTLLAVRSSANGEDLTALSGAGLYDSCVGVPARDCARAIGQVWASLWTERAYASRVQNGTPHSDIQMAILLQELVVPDYAFIMHTRDPISPERDQVWVELALGLGETLASAAQPGTPYRLLCDRSSGEIRLSACASFSLALAAQPGGGIRKERIDYSRAALSTDPAAAAILGRRLVRIAGFLESKLDGPQDVEGVVTDDRIYIVQARPQQGGR